MLGLGGKLSTKSHSSRKAREARAALAGRQGVAKLVGKKRLLCPAVPSKELVEGSPGTGRAALWLLGLEAASPGRDTSSLKEGSSGPGRTARPADAGTPWPARPYPQGGVLQEGCQPVPDV